MFNFLMKLIPFLDFQKQLFIFFKNSFPNEFNQMIAGLKFLMAQYKIEKVPVEGSASCGKCQLGTSASWGTKFNP